MRRSRNSQFGLWDLAAQHQPVRLSLLGAAWPGPQALKVNRDGISHGPLFRPLRPLKGSEFRAPVL